MTFSIRRCILSFICLCLLIAALHVDVHAGDKLGLERQFNQIDQQMAELMRHAKTDIVHLACQEIIRGALGKISIYYNTTQPAPIRFEDLPEYDREVYRALLHTHQLHNNYGLVLLATKDGGFVRAPDHERLFVGFDPRESVWYIEGIHSPQPIILSSSHLSTSGRMVFSMTCKVYDFDNKLIGLAAIDLKMADIINEFNRLAEDEKSFVIILSGRGTTADILSIAHNDGTPAKLIQTEALLPAFEQDQCEWQAAIDGQAMRFTGFASQHLGWKIIVVSPQD